MGNNTQKQLLVFSPYLTTSNTAASVRVAHFLQAFKSVGIDTQVLTSDPKATTNHTQFRTPANTLSINQRLLKEILIGIEISYKMLSTSRLVLLSSPPYITTLICACILGFFRKPYILDIRDLYPDVYFSYGLLERNSIWGKFLRTLTRFIYKRAKLIIGATKSLSAEIAILVPQMKNQILTIRNGFDLNHFSPVEHSDFKLVFHGNLGRFQNIDLLLEVAYRLHTRDPEVSITVIGDGIHSEKLRTSELPNINFIGPMSFKDIAQEIPKYALGLSFRSDSEYNKHAFPVKVFEYIGSGLPVITSPQDEAGQSIVADRIGYVFQNNEADKIVDAIIRLKTDKSRYSELKNNVLRVRENFTRQNQSKLLAAKVLEL